MVGVPHFKGNLRTVMLRRAPPDICNSSPESNVNVNGLPLRPCRVSSWRPMGLSSGAVPPCRGFKDYLDKLQRLLSVLSIMFCDACFLMHALKPCYGIPADRRQLWTCKGHACIKIECCSAESPARMKFLIHSACIGMCLGQCCQLLCIHFLRATVTQLCFA